MGGEQHDGFSIEHTSIDGSSNLLIEIAGLLHEGRLDADLGTAAREPRVHTDVADQVSRFTRFASNQYADTVALYAALSTRLRAAGGSYVEVDNDRARDYLGDVLDGDYRSPEARPTTRED